jgi:hypothetical protein
MKAPVLDVPITTYPVAGSNAVEKVQFTLTPPLSHGERGPDALTSALSHGEGERLGPTTSHGDRGPDALTSALSHGEGEQDALTPALSHWEREPEGLIPFLSAGEREPGSPTLSHNNEEPHPSPDGRGAGGEGVEGRVWINPTQYFGGIPEEVWAFKVGGYQVCDKWLKDRKGRILSGDEIMHYQRIVVALRETMRLMAEIDAAIPQWPLA